MIGMYFADAAFDLAIVEENRLACPRCRKDFRKVQVMFGRLRWSVWGSLSSLVKTNTSRG
jgi:hypothetical protein